MIYPVVVEWDDTFPYKGDEPDHDFQCNTVIEYLHDELWLVMCCFESGPQ